MPRGTPPEVQKILHDGFKKAIEDPAFVRTADRLVFDLEYQPADETARRLARAYQKNGELIRRIGLPKR